MRNGLLQHVNSYKSGSTVTVVIFTTVGDLQLQHFYILNVCKLKAGYINVQVDFELDHSGSKTVRLNCVLISTAKTNEL